MAGTIRSEVDEKRRFGRERSTDSVDGVTDRQTDRA